MSLVVRYELLFCVMGSFLIVFEASSTPSASNNMMYDFNMDPNDLPYGPEQVKEAYIQLVKTVPPAEAFQFGICLSLGARLPPNKNTYTLYMRCIPIDLPSLLSLFPSDVTRHEAIHIGYS
eukprot:TRINITY_DN12700_c0_g2_i1.p1 TRINITY_DN12700_c0_g2~~TRINITY_DN12700_c0_g2_i1.p1  ORF type:complete len:135 (-),score=16.11 TRINITY_DN12700_c0_g2_i1:53-415(-)